MKYIYLIGKNIQYSLSPKIFNYIFKELKLDVSYQLKEFNDQNACKSFLSNERTNNRLLGFNVTIPYKEFIYTMIDKIKGNVNIIKSINCVKNDNAKYIGYNTDEYGFLKMIKNNNINLKNKNILILGYGGVAKTVAYSLLSQNVKNIYIWGRDDQKTKNFIFQNNNKIIVHKKTIHNNYIVINCTPININEDSINNILGYIPISNIELMLDLNYIQTLFMKKLVDSKCNLITGIDMLIYQALKTVDILFDHKYSNQINYENLKTSILNNEKN